MRAPATSLDADGTRGLVAGRFALRSAFGVPPPAPGSAEETTLNTEGASFRVESGTFFLLEFLVRVSLCGFVIGSPGRPPEPRGRRLLSRLNALQVPAKVRNSERGFLAVTGVYLTKKGSPHRHLGRAVCRQVRAELKHRRDVIVREFPPVALCQDRQVRRLLFQCPGNRPVPPAIGAMARRAIAGI